MIRIGHDVRLHASMHFGEEMRIIVAHQRTNLVDKRHCDDLGSLCIRVKTLDNLSDVNSLGTLAPRVIVCSRSNEYIAKLSFASELCFREGRHVDDVTAPLTVHVGFSTR